MQDSELARKVREAHIQCTQWLTCSMCVGEREEEEEGVGGADAGTARTGGQWVVRLGEVACTVTICTIRQCSTEIASEHVHYV